MSVITHISGWIETDGYQKDYNDNIMKELPYDDNFIKMFCSPKETGSKNPDYINFGASINYCIFTSWIEEFESFIKKLKAFNAVVFVESETCGDKAFVIGYELDNTFVKDIINFGEPFQYSIEIKSEDEDEFIYPLIFRILKNLSNNRDK